MLTPELEALWEAYLQAEKVAVRSRLMPALEAFIEGLLTQPAPIWKGWARALAAAVADKNRPVPVRLPLFKRVLLPALWEGTAAGDPVCARWLGAFGQQLAQAGEAAPCTADWLLREALRLDPEDDRARRRLIASEADYLRYTLHEVPSGVLYAGPHGASAQQCDEMLEELRDFQNNLELTGQVEKYADLVTDCQRHYAAYRDYLNTRQEGDTYAAYLANTSQG